VALGGSYTEVIDAVPDSYALTMTLGGHLEHKTLQSEELRVRMPPSWQAHVRWRDGNLLASITPLPYQTAFELWYDNGRLFEDLRELCPGRDGEVWGLLGPTQDIVLEPTVGGKSGFAARVSCRQAKLNQS
jgi:hypothetical protein